MSGDTRAVSSSRSTLANPPQTTGMLMRDTSRTCGRKAAKNSFSVLTAMWTRCPRPVRHGNEYFGKKVFYGCSLKGSGVPADLQMSYVSGRGEGRNHPSCYFTVFRQDTVPVASRETLQI